VPRTPRRAGISAGSRKPRAHREQTAGSGRCNRQGRRPEIERPPGRSPGAVDPGMGKRRSRPISRVLSGATIHLGPASPRTSSDLPKSPGGQPVPRTPKRHGYSSIWSCSRWGLPCRGVLPPARCALTAPFHPYRGRFRPGRYLFCGTFRGLAPPRGYLAPCPQEPGLSSRRRKRRAVAWPAPPVTLVQAGSRSNIASR